MPGIISDLKITNLQRRNFNSIALELWDIPNPTAGTTVTLNVDLSKDKCTIQWGDNTQNTSTTKNITVGHTY
jgi:hypothetical protein